MHVLLPLECLSDVRWIEHSGQPYPIFKHKWFRSYIVNQRVVAIFEAILAQGGFIGMSSMLDTFWDLWCTNNFFFGRSSIFLIPRWLGPQSSPDMRWYAEQNAAAQSGSRIIPQRCSAYYAFYNSGTTWWTGHQSSNSHSRQPFDASCNNLTSIQSCSVHLAIYFRRHYFTFKYNCT